MAAAVTAIAPPLSHSLAVQLGDGSTVFTSPPRLVDFFTLENSAGRKGVTYYVTVDLLPEAGEPLETLKVALIQGRFTQLDYRTDEIEVFEGDRSDRQDNYPIELVEYDETSQTLTIRLAQAVPPGERVTFALKPVRNPTRGGVYLFEVTAAPTGDNPVFQRIGTGRISIFHDPLPGI
jgi:hypothetical protein